MENYEMNIESGLLGLGNNGASTAIVTSERVRARNAILQDKITLPYEEKARIESNQFELVDNTITLKTYYTASEEQELLSNNKNNTPRRGINDFQDGRLVTMDGGGTFVLTSIKFSFAQGVATDDPATKSYVQTNVATDMENSLIEFSQNGTSLKKFKLSEFIFKGDEPQDIESQWKRLHRPITIAIGTQLKIRLLRPELLSGAEGFIAIEAKGHMTFERRTRR